MRLFTPSSICDDSGFRQYANFLSPNSLVEGKAEMSRFESAFLAGLLKKTKPKKILEVGVAAGGTTALMLATLKEQGSDAHLFSVDLNERYYRDNSKATGFLVQETMPGPHSNWTLFAGAPLPAWLDSIGGEIDFVILDTSHALPGELLDFIVALPYLREKAVLVLHDLHAYIGSAYPAYATKVLFDSIVGKKIICEDAQKKHRLPNIGAVFLTKDTRKYTENLFYSLSMPWHLFPDAEERYLYSQSIKKNYGDEYERYFHCAVAANVEFLFKK